MKKAAKIPPREEEEGEGETEHSGSPPDLMGREINFEPLALPPPAQRSSPRERSLAPLSQPKISLAAAVPAKSGARAIVLSTVALKTSDANKCAGKMWEAEGCLSVGGVHMCGAGREKRRRKRCIGREMTGEQTDTKPEPCIRRRRRRHTIHHWRTGGTTSHPFLSLFGNRMDGDGT